MKGRAMPRQAIVHLSIGWLLLFALNAEPATAARKHPERAKAVEIPRGGPTKGGPAAATTGASFESMAITAIASVLASRAKAELQAYAIEMIRDIACEPTIKPWLPRTCAFASYSPDELPVTFGTGIRAALVQDALDFPEHAIDIMTPIGSSGQLMATTLLDSIVLLHQNADLYQIAALMVRLNTPGSDDSFKCEPSDSSYKECTALLSAMGIAGGFLEVILQEPDQLNNNAALIEAIKRAAKTLMPDRELTDADINRLIASVRDARTKAETLFSATTSEDRRNKIKPLVLAIEDTVNLALKMAGSSERLPDGLPDLADAIAHGDAQQVVAEALTILPQLFPNLDARIVRLMSFGAELAQAKTPSDMQAAVESVIAPIASYRMKAKQPMLSITGLVGVAYGSERLVGNQVVAGQNGSSSIASPVGLVGIDLTTPTRWSVVPSIGLLVSVIDLGSLMSVRFSDNPIMVNTGNGATMATVSKDSTVGFAQVFSPGVFLRLAAGGSPLVLAGGVAWVPDARQVTEMGGGQNVNLSAIRIYATLSVDVTLFPFHL